jgi:hypothetical protein
LRTNYRTKVIKCGCSIIWLRKFTVSSAKDHAIWLGDIRHCFADLGLARTILGYEPLVSLEEGLGELVEWLEGQVAEDRVAQARAELSARGLTV